jgi:hypothetical protein
MVKTELPNKTNTTGSPSIDAGLKKPLTQLYFQKNIVFYRNTFLKVLMIGWLLAHD